MPKWHTLVNSQSSGGISNPLIRCKIAFAAATVPASWLSLIEESLFTKIILFSLTQFLKFNNHQK